MVGFLNFLHERYFLKWTLSPLYGWPPKDNILIKVQTKKLPQIFNTLSLQKETFSNCEGKKILHGEEL